MTSRQKRLRRADDAQPTVTSAVAVVETLLAHGIDTLYALPGVQNDLLFDALFKASDRMRTVHARHEQTAAYMALGAALATGKPQAYAVVPGPGLLNSSAALLTAYSMNAPVLALVGEIPDADVGRHLGHLHEIRDQAGIIARLVDHSARIRRPEDGVAPDRAGAARDGDRAARSRGAAVLDRRLGQTWTRLDRGAALCSTREDRRRARSARRRSGSAPPSGR